jgi:hypothetical protein
MKSIRVSVDFAVEYNDAEPGEFAKAMDIVRELLTLEIDGDQVKVVQTRSDMTDAKKIDPRDPDPSRSGIFRDHNCSYCNNGQKPCRQGSSRGCEYPHARND